MTQYPWFVEKMSSYDADFFAEIEGVMKQALNPDALDKKTSLLIVLALDALKGAGEGVKVVAGQAREAGASDEEIKEALRLAYYVAGMDIIKASVNAF